MCLAVPACIDELTGDDAWVALGDARVRVNLCMTPDAGIGDWVLVHAGFAIQQLDEQAVHDIWEMMGDLERARAEEGAPS